MVGECSTARMVRLTPEYDPVPFQEAGWTPGPFWTGAENFPHNGIRSRGPSSRCFKGTAVAEWLRCCAKNRKVAGSIPAGVSGIFH